MDRSVKIAVRSLAPGHQSRFLQALEGLLSTELAERAFAQIIDGLPTRDDVGYFPSYNTDIRDNSLSSAEAIEAAKRFRHQLGGRDIEIDAKKAQLYQNAPIGSSEFEIRLLEMLTVACHDLARILFDNTQPGIRAEVQDPERRLRMLEHRPTNFIHGEYRYWEQYPHGLGDVAGYWAESHLFGGVVLFDRGESSIDCKSVFIHPVGNFMIFKLSDAQMQHFSEYTKQNSTSASRLSAPYPFKAERYAYRVDPFDAMSLNIYRDKYERIIPQERPRRCVRRGEDDPFFLDLQAHLADTQKSTDERTRIHGAEQMPPENVAYLDYLLDPAKYEGKTPPPAPPGTHG